MKKILAAATCLLSGYLYAQDPMDSLMNLDTPVVKEYTQASFKSTRVISFPTMENVRKGVLDFLISHRFGDISSGANNAFGLDGPASIRLGFDYGLHDVLMIGIGRSSRDKMLDGSIKWRICRQTIDNKTPVSLTLFETINYTTQKDPLAAINGFDKYGYASDRLSYSSALILGRKFSERVTLELNGFWVHYNLVDHARDKNDMFAAGFSGRVKLKKRFAITYEYAFRLNKYSDNFSNFVNPMGIGFDLETGGHVFQCHLTNAAGMNEVQYIPYTSSDWLKGGIKLGFNISRAFSIGHKGGSSW